MSSNIPSISTPTRLELDRSLPSLRTASTLQAEPSVLFSSAALDIIDNVISSNERNETILFTNNSASASELFQAPSKESAKEISFIEIPSEIKKQKKEQELSEKLVPYLNPEKIQNRKPKEIIEAAQDFKNFKDPDLLLHTRRDERINIIKLLINAGVNLDSVVMEKGSSVLSWLVCHNCLEEVQTLLPFASFETINKVDEFGDTLLIKALDRNYKNLARDIFTLLSREAVSAINIHGITALGSSIDQNFLDLAWDILLETSFEAKGSVTGIGATALNLALAKKAPDLAQALVPDSLLNKLLIYNGQVYTPSSFATFNGFPEIAELIENTIIMNYAHYNIPRNDVHTTIVKGIEQEFYDNIPDFIVDNKGIKSKDLKAIIGEYCYGFTDTTLAMAAINKDRSKTRFSPIKPDIKNFLEYIEEQEKVVTATSSASSK